MAASAAQAMSEGFRAVMDAAASAWDRDPREYADSGWQCPSGIRIHDFMVAAVEEVHRARAFAEAVL